MKAKNHRPSPRQLAAQVTLLETRVQQRTAELTQANEALRQEMAQRQLATEALALSERRYRQLFDRNPDGIFAVDVNGRFVLANPACEVISGYPLAELTQKTFMDLCAPDQLPRVMVEFQRAWREPGYSQMETALLRKDGRRVEVWIAGERIDSCGTPVLHCTARDTTARKQAELEIQRLNAELHSRLEETNALLEILPTGVWIGNPDCSVITGNPAAYQMLGLTPGTNVSVTNPTSEVPAGLRIFVNGVEVPPEHAPMQQVSRTGKPWHNLEHELLFPDGTRRTVFASIVPLFDRHGAVRKVIGAYADFTERKRAEEGLRHSQAMLARAEKIANAGSWEWDIVSGNITWSEQTYRIFGTDPAHFVPTLDRVLARVHPEDRELVTEAIRQALANRKPYDLEYRLALPGPISRWLHARGEVTFDQAQNPTRMTGSVLDITARKEAEGQLRELTQRLTYHVDHSPLAVIEWGPDMRLVRWSGNAERLFGWKAEEVLGKRMEDFRWIYEEDQPRVAEVAADLATGSDPRRFSANRNYRKDGSIVHCEWYNSSLVEPSSGLRSLLSLVLDVTERKAAEAALQQAQAKLKAHADDLEKIVASRTAKLRETIGELEHFSYAIVHDLRAPLRAMQGFAEMIEAECAGCERDLSRQYFRRIKIAANRMDLLIADSLSYSQAVRQELALQPVNLFPLIDGLVQTYPNLQPGQADIQVDTNLPTVLGNEAALTQCFSNLLGNAVKFAKTGITPKIRVWLQPEDGRSPDKHGSAQSSLPAINPSVHQSPNPSVRLARIWVEDDGIGIPKEAQQRIFGMFQRATTEREGTGIGLAIVRKVVERMGGQVGVESEEGQGSRFWVELPLA